jgi:pantothenate synthetase
VIEDPVARYKELLGLASDATHQMSEYQRRRAVELVEEVADAQRAITRAAEAESKVVSEITEWWREMRATMASLRWITPGPLPKPDTAADPELLSEYLSRIEPLTEELRAAMRKAGRGRIG